MATADPLSQLRDIHLPELPSVWPPAPGWWIAAILSVVFVWAILHISRKIYQRYQPSRAVRRQLMEVNINVDGEQKLTAVQQMSQLVRQFSISRFGRERVAGLVGDEWLHFLDDTSKDKNIFSSGIGKYLGDAQFSQNADIDLEQLKEFLINWSRQV